MEDEKDEIILRVDPARSGLFPADPTAVYVRAINPNGKWDSVDCAYLNAESFDAWITSRGEVSAFALGFLHILLGYPQ